MKFLLLLLFFIFSLSAETIFLSPLPEEDYVIHFGESFCDELYYHSYRSKKFHTAIDYIKKWKANPIIRGETDYDRLLTLYKKQFITLPTQADFWNHRDKAISFMKLNLYRDGFEIVDTDIGLYPKEEIEKSYGYGDTVYSIYPGIVVDAFNPSTPSGWGKSLLIEHRASDGKIFQISWNQKSFRLEKFYSGYFHNSSNLVNIGDFILQGTPICKIGDANGIFHSLYGKPGIREGAHLHFEIRLQKHSLFPTNDILSNQEKLKEIYIDPEYFLKNAKLRKRE
jgi:hypothetical protein